MEGRRRRTIPSGPRTSGDIGGIFWSIGDRSRCWVRKVHVVPAPDGHTSSVAHVTESGRRRRVSIIGGSQAPTRVESRGFLTGDLQMDIDRDGMMATQADSGSGVPHDSGHIENESLEEAGDFDSTATLWGGEDDVGSVVSGFDQPPSEEDILDVDVRVVQLVLREAFRSLDEVDVCQIFRRRATVMKSVPRCI